MGVLVTTEALYVGVKTGSKRNSGEAWCMHQFKVPEIFKGCTLTPEQLSIPNLSAFAVDGLDSSGLQANHKYRIDIEVGAKLSNGRSFLESKLVRIHPPRTA
jgi:hypothetical protein